jgi:organic radical activating enzyme
MVDETYLLNLIAGVGGHPRPPLVVLTGGEPALQVTTHLVMALKAMGYRVAMETNGTMKPPGRLDWLTVSPKPGAPLAVHSCNEVKIVLTDNADPAELAGPIMADHYWIQACSLNHEAALRYVQDHPEWRLSVQWNRLIGWR